ncbi:hypothetical protein LTR70_007995 [Exophiala xenobiotica]|uniref:peptidyl-tRNA hydrolase n=1 Tax=Lithohypha guttulata TaxID=1690604 RepID=A0ABR0KMI2_9EURO|nr:hypothetical protein LTR24_001098 [Lithohypha guttulata]KAK5312740.1 hypothetical protein LTR70_007995 [Exophiala xenobiotica]
MSHHLPKVSERNKKSHAIIPKVSPARALSPQPSTKAVLQALTSAALACYTCCSRIRKDSLSHLQIQQAIHSGSQAASSPALCSLRVHSRLVPGSPRVSEEQGKRILREASRKRSEPFPEEIAEALRNFKIEQKSRHANIDGPEASVAGPATVEQSISEPTSEQTPSKDPPTAKDNAQPTTDRKLSLTRPHSPTSQRKPTRSPRPQPPPSDPQALFTKSVRHLRAASSINLASTTTTDPSTASTTMSRPVSLLIASLGNPPPYHSTRHSAAHLVLKSLQQSLSLPPFTPKHKSYGGGHISIGADVGRPEFTLYQSAVQMNISGGPLLKAWRHFSQLSDGAGRTAGLIVLHDEMEIAPGNLKVRYAGGSAKGHNGVKSVQQALQSAHMININTQAGLGKRFIKVGVGIGRPAGDTRTSKDVSAFVLGQLTSREKDGLEKCAVELEGLLFQEMARIALDA